MEFTVRVPEVWYQGMKVEASDADEAREIAMNGGGEVIEGLFDYSHTIDNEDLFVVDGE